MAIRRSATLFVASAAFAAVVSAQAPTLDLAERLDESGQCAQAEAVYKAVLRGHPDVAALNNFGNHYLRCSQPENARAVFEKLLAVDPGHANANLQMARLALGAKQPARALAFLAHVANPDPEIRVAKAEALVAMGRRAEAQHIIDDVGKTTRDPRYLYALGMFCAHAEFYGEAEDAFLKVLKEDPDDPDVLFNLGVAAARTGHYDRARTAFTTLLDRKPEDADTLFELGRVEASSSNYKRAIYLLSQARRLQPSRPDIDLALARATAMGGFYGDSIQAYDRYLAARPGDESATRDRALVEAFTRAGHEKGAQALAHWVEQHPNDATGHYDLALLPGADDSRRAVEELSRAIALDPHFGPALFLRAWLLEKAGNYAASLRDAKAAAASGAPSARSLDLIGLDELNLSHATEAEPVLRKALDLAPNDADIAFHLGRCLAELGRSSESRQLMNRFRQLSTEVPDAPREEPGIVEAATLPQRELARRMVAEYQEGVSSSPNDAALRLHFAEALIAAGDLQRAEQAFRDLLSLSPGSRICADAGTALLGIGEYKLAIDFLRRAVREYPDAAIDLAAAELRSEGPDAALRILDSAQLAPSGNALIVRASILEATGKQDAARAEMRQAIASGASNPGLISAGALLLRRLGEPQAALQFLDGAISRTPDSKLLRQTRIAILTSIGRLTEAAAEAKALENRWPESYEGYLAEAAVLRKQSRLPEMASRIAIAEALGAHGPAVDCLRSGNDVSPCPCSGKTGDIVPECGFAEPARN